MASNKTVTYAAVPGNRNARLVLVNEMFHRRLESAMTIDWVGSAPKHIGKFDDKRAMVLCDRNFQPVHTQPIFALKFVSKFNEYHKDQLVSARHVGLKMAERLLNAHRSISNEDTDVAAWFGHEHRVPTDVFIAYEKPGKEFREKFEVTFRIAKMFPGMGRLVIDTSSIAGQKNCAIIIVGAKFEDFDLNPHDRIVRLKSEKERIVIFQDFGRHESYFGELDRILSRTSQHTASGYLAGGKEFELLRVESHATVAFASLHLSVQGNNGIKNKPRYRLNAMPFAKQAVAIEISESQLEKLELMTENIVE